MAEEQKPAAGAVAEIDYEKLGTAMAKALAPSIGTAVAEANKPLHEMLGKLAQPAPDAAATDKGDGKGKPITLDDVAKLLDTKLNQQQTSARQADERKGFVADKLKDLPAAYQNQLGNDPTKWAAEEQKIREQFKADFKGLGGKTAPVGGDNPGGNPPAKVVDISKMSPTQKLEVGIKQEAAAKSNAAAATT